MSACATPLVLGRNVFFSNQRWEIVESAGPIGPGPNRFSRRNISLDSRGALVLETRGDGQAFTSAGLFLSRSLGYGRYEIELSPIEGGLDDRTVFGFYTWDGDPAYANREIDIELSRWGIAGRPLLGFVVQPGSGNPGRAAAFELDPSTPIMLSFDWKPAEIVFTCIAGGRETRWVFPGAEAAPLGNPPFLVPPRGNERVGLNLWLYEGVAPRNYDRVAIRSFTFTAPPP